MLPRGDYIIIGVEMTLPDGSEWLDGSDRGESCLMIEIMDGEVK